MVATRPSSVPHALRHPGLPGGAVDGQNSADQDGNPVTRNELRGGPVVVYFYPKADAMGF
jgi:cytochrome oxidase Cu insertion factor (SCO1/SenC/PrrC family)